MHSPLRRLYGKARWSGLYWYYVAMVMLIPAIALCVAVLAQYWFATHPAQPPVSPLVPGYVLPWGIIATGYIAALIIGNAIWTADDFVKFRNGRLAAAFLVLGYLASCVWLVYEFITLTQVVNANY